MVRKLQIITLFILILPLVLLVNPVKVNAIADPDTPPQVSSVYVFEDLLEDGDVGIFVDYYLDYAVTPTELVTEAYLVSFIDTDGTTQLSSIAPYAYNDSGYGRGAAWIYFTADEVTSLSIDAANEALYTVWLHGNPTVASGWVGDPPKTISMIDEWYETGEGDADVLLRLVVLNHGSDLEDAWSLDVIENTVSGTRLTDIGEAYYTNVINDLRTMSPACFASGEYGAIYEDLDYTTTFGAILYDGTGTAFGTPITFDEGTTVVTVLTAGTLTVVLEKGTTGTVTSVDGILGGDIAEHLLGEGVVPTGTFTLGSPASGPVFLGFGGEDGVTLVAGINTLTTIAAGTITVVVNLLNTQTVIHDLVDGTAFDLTDIADEFGMSRTAFSGLLWLMITIIICAATYKTAEGYGGMSITGGSTKAVMVVFDVCILGGALLGLLPIMFAALLFIGFGFLTSWVMWGRNASY